MKKLRKNIASLAKVFGLVAALCFLLSPNAIAETKLSFTTADNQNSARSQNINAVLKECFLRMGISLDIITMPSTRSLENANNGIEDGNFVRPNGITEFYPNLIKVPEKISQSEVSAFAKDKTIKIDGWKSLLGYHVVCINGWQNCERELKHPKQKTIVKNGELLFTLLHKDRAEVGVYSTAMGQVIQKKLKYSEIHLLQPPIESVDLFLYIHKKHEHLIPEIVKTIQLMKEDGTYNNLTSLSH